MGSDAAGRILDMLRNRQERLSGAEISRILGISRSAIWKHISALRREGYQIEAKHASGYQLIAAPAHLTAWEIRAGLGTERFGVKIHAFSHCDSTNTVAFRLALNGAQEGEVVVAESQVAGKGRMGRHWESPPGVNIYLSIIVRPAFPPNKMPMITLMTAVACTEAIEEVTGLLPAIKWPNDLLLNGKKLGGILTEADLEMDRINFVVVGIGINVNMPCSSLPPSIRDTATSLLEALGREISRIALIQALLRNFELWYKRFGEGRGEEIRRRWEKISQIRGKEVEVVFMGERVRGEALEIDEDGALLVQEIGGEVRRIVAGDVHVRG
jgi:BirA family biotin operon repressor/biotin-[acetyl-CoA-carboxylase] ligase